MSKFPNLSSRPVVQWVSRATAPLARDLDEDGPIGAVATSIIGAAHLDNTMTVVRNHGLGVFIDTEAWRTQLEPDDPRRIEEFRRRGLDWLAERFVPSRSHLSQADRNDIVARHRDAQVGGGGTLLVSPCHRVQEGTPLSQGRRLDLALAGDFVALARQSGATQPTPQMALPRRVAVSLAVDARKLEPELIAQLVAAYREIEADLFWIWVWNFDPNGKQYRRVRSLCDLLQHESARPCVVGGIGRLWEAALRNQAAAICQGWGRNELKFPPAALPEVVNGGDEDNDSGWGVHVFHPAIRGTTALGVEAERPLRILFRESPCPCGHHPADQVPNGQRERHFHNCYWAEQLSVAAVRDEPQITTAELAEIVTSANRLRASLGLSPLSTGWAAAATNPPSAPRIDIPADLWRHSA